MTKDELMECLKIIQVDNKHEYTDEEKLRAVYALNLCTVSVGQIIDYADVVVLEQEYEQILNNLNIEKLPKSEALLNILTHLMDTIVFFRIQEGEKDMIEAEYNFQMKNIIWGAISESMNFVSGMLIGGSGFKAAKTKLGMILNAAKTTAKVALAVGTVYVNYRKNKAQYELERDKSYWKLQKTALEQFEALQRELLTCAWKLSDEYGFDDSLRLTEKQIRKYNEILMDTDIYRKYERLLMLEDSFRAYPPLQYYLGSCANAIANDNTIYLSDEERGEYRNKAIACYRNLLNDHVYDILREDPIVTACALEYIEMLDPETDREEILDKIKIAIKMSGMSNDAMEMCAMAYIRVGEMELATDILHKLIVEGYNAKMNGGLLSTYYVQQCYLNDNDLSYIRSRNLLERYVDSKYLFPAPDPSRNIITYQQLCGKFVSDQLILLMGGYKRTLSEYYAKKRLDFNHMMLTKKDYERGDFWRNHFLVFFNKILEDSIYLLKPNAENQRMLTEALSDQLQVEDTIDNILRYSGRNAGMNEYYFYMILNPFMNECISQIRRTIKDIVEHNREVYDTFSNIISLDSKLRDFCKQSGLVDVNKVFEDNKIVETRPLFMVMDAYSGVESKMRKFYSAKNCVEEFSERLIENGTVNVKFYLIGQEGFADVLEDAIDKHPIKGKDLREFSFAVICKDEKDYWIFNLDGIHKNAIAYKYEDIKQTLKEVKGFKCDGLRQNDFVYMCHDLDIICNQSDESFETVFEGLLRIPKIEGIEEYIES